MGDFEFKKDEFIFSKNKNQTKDINKNELVREVRLLGRMCKAYNVNFGLLERKNPTSERRDMLLNIAKFISKDEKIIKVFKKSKKLPLILIGEETGVKLEVLKKWGKYLEFYIILFMDNKYPQINNYLNIQFNEIERLSKIRIVEKEEDTYEGIAITLLNKSIVLLTNQGLLVKVKYIEDCYIGEIIESKKTKEFKAHLIKVCGVLTVMSVIAVCFVLYYNREYTTVVVKTTSEIKVTVNEFNKVVNASSPTQKGKKLIEDEKLKHKSLDNAITSILEYADENAMVPEGGKINLIVTGERIDINTLENTIKNVSNQENDENKKEQEYKLLINNVGIQESIINGVEVKGK